MQIHSKCNSAKVKAYSEAWKLFKKRQAIAFEGGNNV